MEGSSVHKKNEKHCLHNLKEMLEQRFVIKTNQYVKHSSHAEQNVRKCCYEKIPFVLENV